MHEKLTPMAQIAIHLSFVITALMAHKLRAVHLKRSACGIGRAILGLIHLA